MSRLYSPTAPITDRQRQIAEHVMRGEPDKAIANALGITPATVVDTVSLLMRKTGTSNRTALAVALLRAKYEGPQ